MRDSEPSDNNIGLVGVGVMGLKNDDTSSKFHNHSDKDLNH